MASTAKAVSRDAAVTPSAARDIVAGRWLERRWLVVAAALASHLSALTCGFIWLDHGDIEAGAALAPWSGWPSLFARGFSRTGFYRPLVALSLSIDALVGTPWFFHSTNVALHAVASWMVARAAEALGLPRGAAVLAGLVFAVHPMSALITGAVAYRGEAMLVIGLGGLIVAHRGQRVAWSALAVAASCLTKETAFVLAPLVILALEVDRRGGSTSAGTTTATQTRRLWIVEGGAWLLALSLRAAFAPPWHARSVSLPLSEAVGTRLALLAKNAVTMAIPVSGSICDAFPLASLSSLPAAAGLVLLVALVMLARRRRGPALLLALALLPTCHLVPVPRFFSPHYLYLPMAFAAMLLAERLEGSRRRMGAALAVCATLGAITFARGTRYRTDRTLWEPEVAANPACREGQFYLARAFYEAGALPQAAEHYALAAEPPRGFVAYTDRGAALENLGAVRLQQDRPREAAQAYFEALSVTSDAEARRQLVYNGAIAAWRSGDPGTAEQLLRDETSRAEPLGAALLLRATALHALGREREATTLLARARRAPSP